VTDFTKVIPPGSEGKISASVNLSHGAGSIEKSITVTSNDPARSQVKLTLKALVKSYVEIQPADQVRFTATKGQASTQELALTPTYSNPIHLKDPVSDSDVLTAELIPAGPPSKPEMQYKLKLTLKDTAKVGTQNMTVKLTAQGSPQSVITIPVTAIVRGPISANPPMINFIVKSYPDEVAGAASTDLHQQAQGSSPVTLTTPAGTAFRIINQTPEWYQVITQPTPGNQTDTIGNHVGWVLKSAVKVTKESQAPVPQNILLKKDNSKPFKVLSYTSTLPQVKVEMLPGGNGTNYVLRVTLGDVERKQQTVPGSIQIKTDDPDEPDLSVPVYVIVS